MLLARAPPPLLIPYLKASVTVWVKVATQTCKWNGNLQDIALNNQPKFLLPVSSRKGSLARGVA